MISIDRSIDGSLLSYNMGLLLKMILEIGGYSEHVNKVLNIHNCNCILILLLFALE
jgi:hypothetical protein